MHPPLSSCFCLMMEWLVSKVHGEQRCCAKAVVARLILQPSNRGCRNRVADFVLGEGGQIPCAVDTDTGRNLAQYI